MLGRGTVARDFRRKCLISNVKNERTKVPNETKTFWYRSKISLIDNRLFQFGPESAHLDKIEMISFDKNSGKNSNVLVSFLYIGTFVGRLFHYFFDNTCTVVSTSPKANPFAWQSSLQVDSAAQRANSLGDKKSSAHLQSFSRQEPLLRPIALHVPFKIKFRMIMDLNLGYNTFAIYVKG